MSKFSLAYIPASVEANLQLRYTVVADGTVRLKLKKKELKINLRGSISADHHIHGLRSFRSSKYDKTFSIYMMSLIIFGIEEWMGW